MDKQFDIFVDSSANLTDAMVAETGIKVIPYICTVNGEERECYQAGTPFEQTAKEFYESMAQGADVKTSLVSEERIVSAVTPSLQEGRAVLFVTIASGISGTHAQALNAQKALKQAFPERKIIIVDSANASLGQGLLALHAAKLKQMGESIDACAEWIEDNRYKMNSYVTVNDLKYLRRGGRISTAVAIAGTLLNIKPLLRADGGFPAKLGVYGKERGRRKSIDAIVKGFTENVINPENQTVAIAHANCGEEAEKVADMLRERGARDIIIEYYDLCTGTHVGPGTIAIFFMGKDRRGHIKKEPLPQGKAVVRKI